MKVITFANEKGGAAKSTLAVHTAAGLAIRGHRVVLMDTDPQGHAALLLGKQKATSFYDLIMRAATWKSILELVEPERYTVPDEALSVRGQLLLCASNIEARNIASNYDDTFVIYDRVKELQGYVDFMIIDTAPTPSMLHSAIYMASDYIIYPTKLEALNFDGLRESLNRKTRYDAIRSADGIEPTQIAGIIPTMVRRQTFGYKDNLDKLITHFGDLVWDAIPNRVVISDASDRKKAVFAVAPDSEAASELWGVVDRVEVLRERTRS